MEKATTSNTKQLWALLKSTDNWGIKMNVALLMKLIITWLL